jgi:hypothetical protein
MRGKEHVLKSVSSKDNLLTPSQLVDTMKDLIPGVLRHQADECIQANDGLLIEMLENSRGEKIDLKRLPLLRMNIWIRFQKRTHRHRYLWLR